MDDFSSCPPALADAITRGRLVVVAGAGISVLPPSSLPSWWGFNEALLKALRQAAQSLLPPGYDELLQDLTLDRIPVVAFSDHVVRSFAGEAYFPMLGLLESSRPNANHRALAELARRGCLQHIVTPNFDTLIERAFRDADVALEVLIGRDSPAAVEGRGRARTMLHKIHGSANDKTSLVDTVSQKLRGLSTEQRAALEEAFADGHVLFIGFSGADFDFDPDYLPLSKAMDTAGQAFTWVSRPGTQPPPIARKLARNASWLVEGELPQWFETLGLDPETLITASSAQLGAPVSTPAVNLPERIAEWIAQPAFGPWACAALCLRLLTSLRLHAPAQTFESLLSEALDAELQRPEGVALGTGAAMRQLMSAAAQRGDFASARRWCMLELRFLHVLREAATRKGPSSDEATREHLRNTAGVWINLALMWRKDCQASGRDEALAMAIQQATTFATQAQDPELLANLFLGHAQDSRLPFAARLRNLRTSQAYARLAGSHGVQIDTLHLQAKLSMGLAELFQAQVALDAASELLKLDTGSMRTWAQHSLEMQLAARSGDPLRAAGAAARMLQAAGDDLDLMDCSQNLRLLYVGSPEQTARPAFLPEMPKNPAIPDHGEQGALRLRLAWAEYERDDSSCLRCLEALCKLEHRGGSVGAWRLADLALALRARARQAGHSETEQVAGNYLGIALELSGQLLTAEEAWRAALAVDELPLNETQRPHANPNQITARGSLRAIIEANLARVVGQSGNFDEALAMFESARTVLRDSASWNSYYTATVNQARLFGQEARPDAAVQLIQHTADEAVALGHSTFVPPLLQLATQFASNHVGPNTRLRRVAPAAGWQRELDRHWKTDGAVSADEAGPEHLATEAMARWEAGDEAEGRRLNLRARELYEQQGHLAGQSRCLNNLATILRANGEHAAALEAFRQALVLRMRTDDVPGQVRTIANLAAQLLQDGLDVAVASEALSLADSGLLLAQGGAVEQVDVVQLQRCALQACLELQQWAEAQRRAETLRGSLQGLEHPKRQVIAAELRNAEDLLAAVQHAIRPPAEEVGAVAMQAIHHAKKLAAGSDRTAAIGVLQAALHPHVDGPPNDIDAGTLHGELANLLATCKKDDSSQNIEVDIAQYLDAAQHHYEQSWLAYERASRAGMAWFARGLSALLRVEKQGESPTTLLDFSLHCPEDIPALNVLTGCANALIESGEEGQDVSALWRALRDQLAARVIDGHADAETLGRAAMQWVQACLATDDLPNARQALALARRHLTRSNSRYLEQLHLLEHSIADAARILSTGAQGAGN